MFKKRKENLSMYVYVLHEGLINFVVVQWTSKKCTKKRDAPAELLFWSWPIVDANESTQKPKRSGYEITLTKFKSF